MWNLGLFVNVGLRGLHRTCTCRSMQGNSGYRIRTVPCSWLQTTRRNQLTSEWNVSSYLSFK